MSRRVSFGNLILAGAVTLVVTATSAAQNAELAAAVEKVLQPNAGKGVTTAVMLIEPVSGRTLYASPNADAALLPASNMKLLTTATTLDRFGADHTLDTVLATAGQDLLVIGGGDPALGDPSLAEDRGEAITAVFDEWAAALRKARLTDFKGDLIVVDPIFDDQLVHPTWSASNRLQWYGAPVAGVNFNDNCVDFTFLPAADGGRAIVQTSPRAGGFRIEGTVDTTSSVKKHNPILGKRPEPIDGESVFPVAGAVAREAGPYSKPVDDPLRFFGEVAKAELAERGIAVRGGVRVTYAMPTGGIRQIATHQTPLRDVLRRVNTNSQNMMAEALAKLNGWEHQRVRGIADARGSWATGHLAAVGLLQRMGIDTLAVVSADGSGLSRENRVSVRVLAELITLMISRHPQGGEFLASLARAGESGSLSRRLENLEGRVFGKTGTINGVSALSGVVTDEHGRAVVFSIIHNNFKGGSAPYRQQQDEIVEAVARWLDELNERQLASPGPEAGLTRSLEMVGAE